MKVLGIDPGWKNLGYAILENRKVIISGTLNPSELTFLGTMNVLQGYCTDHKVDLISIERFVSYAGTLSEDSERIIMLIGGLRQISNEILNKDCVLARAIDWKTKLVKHFYKTEGYSNPSDKLDKKFSDSLATHIIGEKPKNNHISDAISIAYYGDYIETNKTT